MMSTKIIIKKLIGNDTIEYIMFGRAYCKYCKLAKDLLNTALLKYIDLDIEDPDEEYIDAIKKETNMNTIPIIFHLEPDGNLKLVGGFTELKNHLVN